jgi:hypothetical protein
VVVVVVVVGMVAAAVVVVVPRVPQKPYQAHGFLFTHQSAPRKDAWVGPRSNGFTNGFTNGFIDNDVGGFFGAGRIDHVERQSLVRDPTDLDRTKYRSWMQRDE